MPRPRKWDKEGIVSAIQVFASQHNRPPTWQEFAECRDGLPHHATVREYFGGRVEACAAAGFEVAGRQPPRKSHVWRRTIYPDA